MQACRKSPANCITDKGTRQVEQNNFIQKFFSSVYMKKNNNTSGQRKTKLKYYGENKSLICTSAFLSHVLFWALVTARYLETDLSCL